jgi:thioredoxin-like negative regulator of GroEL
LIALERFQREVLALENHLKTVPEDARARVLLAADYAAVGQEESAVREANLTILHGEPDFERLYPEAVEAD